MLKSFLSSFCHTKNAPVEFCIKQILSVSTNHCNVIIMIGDFFHCKSEPKFISFNPCPSLPSVSTDGRKQFQYFNTVLKITKIQHYF